MGLVENSSVILVASMLVSPIMGPILAIVFGTRIKNKKLVKIGIYREMYSLLICIICGFIFGCLFVVKFNRTRNVLAVTSLTWPSPEMASRTGWSCLVVGLAIAIPNGVDDAIAYKNDLTKDGEIVVDNETFKFEYAEYGDIPQELFFRGAISFTLTMVNIVCIVIV